MLLLFYTKHSVDLNTDLNCLLVVFFYINYLVIFKLIVVGSFVENLTTIIQQKLIYLIAITQRFKVLVFCFIVIRPASW